MRGHAKQAVIHITLPDDAGEIEPGEIDAVLIVKKAGNVPASSDPGAGGPGARPLEPLASYLDRARVEHVRAALRAANGSRKAAARALGVDVRTIFRILGATSRSRDRQIDQLRVGEALPEGAHDAARDEEDH